MRLGADFHPVNGPKQIDRRRSRRGHDRAHLLKARPELREIDRIERSCPQRQTQGGSDADGWSPTHGERFNRLSHGMEIVAFDDHFLSRQAALIDQTHNAVVICNCVNHGILTDSVAPGDSEVAQRPLKESSRLLHGD